MVATAVLAVLAVGATMSLGSRPGPTDQSRFQALFETQRALAVSGRRTRGFEISPRGVQLRTKAATGWALAGPLIRWRGRVVFSPQGVAAPGDPSVVFLADGRTTPLVISFARGGRCQSDGWTGLTCSPG